MSRQCHTPSTTCHSSFYYVNWHAIFSLHKSHYVSNPQLCMPIDVLLGVLSFCMSNIKSSPENFVRNTHARHSPTRSLRNLFLSLPCLLGPGPEALIQMWIKKYTMLVTHMLAAPGVPLRPLHSIGGMMIGDCYLLLAFLEVIPSSPFRMPKPWRPCRIDVCSSNERLPCGDVPGVFMWEEIGESTSLPDNFHKATTLASCRYLMVIRVGSS